MVLRGVRKCWAEDHSGKESEAANRDGAELAHEKCRRSSPLHNIICLFVSRFFKIQTLIAYLLVTGKDRIISAAVKIYYG